MMTLMKKVTALLLVAVMVTTAFPVNALAVKNKSAIYVSDYRNWAQGSSAYSEMRENGSLITAQAKLLREAGIMIPSILMLGTSIWIRTAECLIHLLI